MRLLQDVDVGRLTLLLGSCALLLWQETMRHAQLWGTYSSKLLVFGAICMMAMACACLVRTCTQMERCNAQPAGMAERMAGLMGLLVLAVHWVVQVQQLAVAASWHVMWTPSFVVGQGVALMCAGTSCMLRRKRMTSDSQRTPSVEQGLVWIALAGLTVAANVPVLRSMPESARGGLWWLSYVQLGLLCACGVYLGLCGGGRHKAGMPETTLVSRVRRCWLYVFAVVVAVGGSAGAAGMAQGSVGQVRADAMLVGVLLVYYVYCRIMRSLGDTSRQGVHSQNDTRNRYEGVSTTIGVSGWYSVARVAVLVGISLFAGSDMHLRLLHNPDAPWLVTTIHMTLAMGFSLQVMHEGWRVYQFFRLPERRNMAFVESYFRSR